MWGIVAIIAVKIVHKALAKRNFYRSDAEQQWFGFALFIIFTSLLCFGVPSGLFAFPVLPVLPPAAAKWGKRL